MKPDPSANVSVVQPRTAHRIWPAHEASFSTRQIGQLKHNFHEHPLLQLAALAALARELEPLHQCRFVRPGITQGASFRHADRHTDGRSALRAS